MTKDKANNQLKPTIKPVFKDSQIITFRIWQSFCINTLVYTLACVLIFQD